MNLDFRNTNSLWGSVLVETWVRCGLTHAVVSPGSRSTPLTFALARHPGVEAVPVLDERSAAFFALGLARRTRRPVVLVCTSGSAGANYLPAVIEAKESGAPLIVVTADRPPELRECASGQTIDQQKLFGGYVSWYHELAVPEPRRELLCYLRQTARQAWRRATLSPISPVHLNAPFRDPLVPVEDGTAAGLAEVVTEAFFAEPAVEMKAGPGIVIHQRAMTARGLIVAGAASPADPAGYAAAVLRLADGLGWPVLADVLSPVRQHAPAGAPVVAAYDTILRHAEAARTLTPRTVICLENWPVSKVLRGWLEQAQAEMLLVTSTPGSRDALHGRTRELVAPVTALAALGSPPGDDSYRRIWQAAEAAAQAGLTRRMVAMDTEQPLFEARAARLLAEHLPDGAVVGVANSMPVRDLEYVWPATDRGRRVFFSRGANGIDGTLSTALGVAHGGPPVVLLTGDLALLHDTNGLLSAGRLRGSLTVVVINNAGGGIFEHLPVAAFDPPFEEFFATPQSVDLARLCAAYGVPHVTVTSWGQFQAAIAAPPAAGVRVLEIKTDRKRDAARRKRLFAEVAAEVGRVLNS